MHILPIMVYFRHIFKTQNNATEMQYDSFYAQHSTHLYHITLLYTGNFMMQFNNMIFERVCEVQIW